MTATGEEIIRAMASGALLGISELASGALCILSPFAPVRRRASSSKTVNLIKPVLKLTELRFLSKLLLKSHLFAPFSAMSGGRKRTMAASQRSNDGSLAEEYGGTVGIESYLAQRAKITPLFLK